MRSLVTLMVMLAGLWLGSVAYAAEGAEVTTLVLKAQPISQGERVTLGDLFENAGDQAGVEVVRIKRAGDRVALDGQALKAFVSKQGLSWPNTEGRNRVMVTRAFVRDYVSPADAEPKVRVPTLNTIVRTGDIIRQDQITWSEVPERLLPNNYFALPEELVGLVAQQTIRPGVVIGKATLKPEPLVRKDELITVVYQAPGLAISLRCKALGDGHKDQAVRCENSTSKRVIDARVIGESLAVIEAANPAVQVADVRGQ